MLSSPIIDLAIGLVFVFGVAAALASFVTELITRFIGLRGAYLLTGLRELVDSGSVSTDLNHVEDDYAAITNLVESKTAPDAKPTTAEPTIAAATSPVPKPSPVPSATGALLGGPILGSQGVAGQINGRKLTMETTSKTGRLPKMRPDPKSGPLWRQLRSLPSYISSTSFAEAVVDLVVPAANGQTLRTSVK